MEYLIIIAGILALWHFVWEGMIAPSLRVSLRHRVFALRDELRNMLLAEVEDVSSEAFDYTQDALNICIGYLHRFNLLECLAARKAYERDEEFRALSDERRAVVEACPEAKRIVDKLSRIMALAFAVNSGAWAVYLIPLVLVLVSFTMIVGVVARFLMAPLSALEDRMPQMKHLQTAH